MGWDRQVMMPPNGSDVRSRNALVLSKMRHNLATSPELGNLIESASGQAENDDDLALIRIARKEFDRETKFSPEFVGRHESVAGDAYQKWRIARPENDFKSMLPFYSELFEIERERAEILGYTDHPYDALIDQYEEGSTFAEARAMFDYLQPKSTELLSRIREEGTPVDDSTLAQEFDPIRLRNVLHDVLAHIGFDFRGGRLDLAPNAFCSGTDATDVRMTTRASDHIKGVLSSSLHEMGHALYEQKQRSEWSGLPIAGGVSLAVHESQSRTWENVVGRSKPFWKFFLPKFQCEFSTLSSLDYNDFYRAYNKVQPSFIRVGADEISYNLHILVRFELEVELITRKIDVKDLPEAWNQKYTDYLGITPPTDTLGCLQDVHWCRGSVGYFPTYTMGNLIGVQIWNKLQSDIGDQSANFEAGDFAPSLTWLTENLYQFGSVYTPKNLIHTVVGASLDPQPWLDYVTTKFGEIYGLE